MSWPLVLTTVAGSLTGAVDIQVAGSLGSTAQAAVGLSEQILFVLMVFVMSVSIGTTAVVSRSFGAGAVEESVHATSQSLVLAIGLGIVLSVMTLLTAQFILPCFTAPGGSGLAPSASAEMLRQGRLYLSIFGVFLVPFSIVTITNAAFRAIGDARTPMVVVAVSAAICITGDILTVRCGWPVAGLGVRGIAFSAITGSTVASIIVLWRLSCSPLKGALKQLCPISWSMIKRIVRIGVPSAAQKLSYSAAVFVLFFILSHCPSPVQAIASWTIGIRVEGILFMPLIALSMAVSSIVGQNLGARQPLRAFQAGWNVTWIGVVMMVVFGTMLFFGAEPLARLMSHDPKAIEYTASYLRINALAEPFLAFAMILSGALQGAGDTRSPMWISIFCNWIIRLPILWLLALKLSLGPTGAWIAMTISITIMGLLVIWRYQSGEWLKVRV